MPRTYEPPQFLQLKVLEKLPDSDKAMQLLVNLTKDPGVIAVMKKYSWTIGLLTELSPIGRHSGILGHNVNKGQEIGLRLRNPSLKSFRHPNQILAVHGPHHAAFHALDRKLRDEVVDLNWMNSGGFQPVTQSKFGGFGAPSAPPADRPPATQMAGAAALKRMWQQTTSGRKLGGGTSASSSLSKRELSARAAMTRITAQEQLMAAACGASGSSAPSAPSPSPSPSSASPSSLTSSSSHPLAAQSSQPRASPSTTFTPTPSGGPPRSAASAPSSSSRPPATSSGGLHRSAGSATTSASAPTPSRAAGPGSLSRLVQAHSQPRGASLNASNTSRGTGTGSGFVLGSAASSSSEGRFATPQSRLLNSSGSSAATGGGGASRAQDDLELAIALSLSEAEANESKTGGEMWEEDWADDYGLDYGVVSASDEVAQRSGGDTSTGYDDDGANMAEMMAACHCSPSAASAASSSSSSSSCACVASSSSPASPACSSTKLGSDSDSASKNGGPLDMGTNCELNHDHTGAGCDLNPLSTSDADLTVQDIKRRRVASSPGHERQCGPSISPHSNHNGNKTAADAAANCEKRVPLTAATAAPDDEDALLARRLQLRLDQEEREARERQLEQDAALARRLAASVSAPTRPVPSRLNQP